MRFAMWRFVIWRFISCLFLLYSSVSSAGTLEKGTAPCLLRMAAEGNFPPHLIYQQQRWSGLSIELMQRLAAEVNCQLSFIPSPWLRAIQLSNQGELDVISQFSYNPARQAQFAFIGPHHIESIYLVGDPALISRQLSFSSLSANTEVGTIAALHGAYYGETFDQLSQQPTFASKLVSISSIQDKLALLRAGRVNAILEDISVLRYWQQHQYPDAERYQGLLKIHESKVYFALSKTSLSADRIAQLAAAWQTLYQQGELTEIYQKYQMDEINLLVPEPRL